MDILKIEKDPFLLPNLGIGGYFKLHIKLQRVFIFIRVISVRCILQALHTLGRICTVPNLYRFYVPIVSSPNKVFTSLFLTLKI